MALHAGITITRSPVLSVETEGSELQASGADRPGDPKRVLYGESLGARLGYRFPVELHDLGELELSRTFSPLPLQPTRTKPTPGQGHRHLRAEAQGVPRGLPPQAAGEICAGDRRRDRAQPHAGPQ